MQSVGCRSCKLYTKLHQCPYGHTQIREGLLSRYLLAWSHFMTHIKAEGQKRDDGLLPHWLTDLAQSHKYRSYKVVQAMQAVRLKPTKWDGQIRRKRGRSVFNSCSWIQDQLGLLDSAAQINPDMPGVCAYICFIHSTNTAVTLVTGHTCIAIAAGLGQIRPILVKQGGQSINQFQFN